MSGNGENGEGKICIKLKDDLKDALKQLDEILKIPKLPKETAKQAEYLEKALRDLKKYIDEHRVFFMDAESLPKRK